jgi:hypothetical protein
VVSLAGSISSAGDSLRLIASALERQILVLS